MEDILITVGSPTEYDELVAYIWIKGNKICLIQQEEGKDNLKIEFNGNEKLSFSDLNLLVEGLEKAKSLL